MRPLSVLLLFLVLAIPLVVLNDAKQDLESFNEEMHRRYTNDFQAAVDDTGAYLSRLESQQTTVSVRYQQEKQLDLDQEMINVFYENLALKFGIENNAVAIQNLKLHIPALVMIRYNGYVMVTLDDTASYEGGQELTSVFWPARSFLYQLRNGNTIYFTMDNNALVYDKGQNRFYQGDYESLSVQTNLAPLLTIEQFKEIRQSTITSLIEQDMATAINRHMEIAKRLGLSVQFTLPKGIDQQSIKDMGFMAFIQGYPLPGGERLDAYSFAGSAVVQRKPWVGTIASSGKHNAYPEQCVPSTGITVIETIYDTEEAVRKGYFLNEC
ncbi:hypothetical protein [Paenibacillus sp. BIHB 4019]|uniref:hypothetical protein n=1 Tax=Paenibacillus sp. BIHB 4019 TaxID=1870819 RepID=UPI001237506A|nr:hypothetical protein [Paenibacillus sp. BIHB 4019]